MNYRLAPLFCRPWTLNGISPRLIESHYENNYGAALNRLNNLSEEIEQLDLGRTSDQTLARLKRDQMAALNSTLLHELYFASLGGDGRVVPDALAAAMAKDFGSVDRWRREFVGIASGLTEGSGWVLLTYVPRDGRLINQIESDHDQGVAGGVPILALDMYEHAYHMEFGANATAYIEAFMRNIDWSVVANRLTQATNGRTVMRKDSSEAQVASISPEELAARRATGESLQIIDARPRFHLSRSADMMEGAVYRDPERVHEGAAELTPDSPVVVYCSYGFNVGCAVAGVLRERGFDARFLDGGL